MVLAGGAAAVTPAGEESVVGLPLTGQEAVDFLTTAEVSSKPEDFDDLAITSPRRLDLTKGDLTLRAIFKDENTQHRGTFKYGDGREVPMVKDSYLHEVAAFELDLMLRLDIVAPCVERKLFKRKGSLCLWVEDSITEAERKEKGLEPPAYKAWNEQLYIARLYQQLISDQDFSNIRNLVVDSNFKLYKIDSSMAFYPDGRLIDKLDPPMYSRDFLSALEALDHDEVHSRLKPWLSKSEINSLWNRRERILERAEKRVAEHGENKILY
jgi:hypothetical protein